jgi:hypothetical protein
LFVSKLRKQLAGREERKKTKQEKTKRNELEGSATNPQRHVGLWF